MYLLGLPLPYNLYNQEHVDTFELLQYQDRHIIRDQSPYFIAYFAVLVIVKFAYHFLLSNYGVDNCFLVFGLLDGSLTRYLRPY